MDLATAKGLWKLANAQFMLQPADIKVQQTAKRNLVQHWLTENGENPALFDYPTGTALSTGQTGSAASTNKATFHGDYFHVPALVRIVTTVGSTPTCTYDIQGSYDNSTWESVYHADTFLPAAWSKSTFTITTAGTVVKVVKAGQPYRYLRLNYTANTNVTNTADVTILGD